MGMMQEVQEEPGAGGNHLLRGWGLKLEAESGYGEEKMDSKGSRAILHGSQPAQLVVVQGVTSDEGSKGSLNVGRKDSVESSPHEVVAVFILVTGTGTGLG